MLKYTPACFSCTSATAPAPPTTTTSVYSTHIGKISLTWNRGLLGLSLIANLQLFPSSAAENQTESAGDHLRFRIFLLLPFKRKGSKWLRLNTDGGRRFSVELVWDLTGATFHRVCGPEPVEGFFFVIAVDGEMALVVGDRRNEAFWRIKAVRPRNEEIRTEQTSKKVEVKLGEIGRSISWMAIARFSGREREVLMSIDLEKKRMRLTINGERVLHVSRLRWNFRGSERVAAEGGDRIQVTWDLFRFLFREESGGKQSPSSAPAIDGDAVIVLRFENVEEGYFGKRTGWGYFGKSANWSEGSGRSWTMADSSKTVEDWESMEDVKLRNSDANGFTLVMCAKRSLN
ncbi:uncharacterized protein LOC110024062 [Phalaenopsis equestris]|uniref:uncharacterized protein LOC110024062 n=1 Tax=Phalaenopsis equestris TaxID=78828 RepID=UPI0009E5D8E0|nr:uncharacterized protein LOC110024062 [Phalaenopsis equestris]